MFEKPKLWQTARMLNVTKIIIDICKVENGKTWVFIQLEHRNMTNKVQLPQVPVITLVLKCVLHLVTDHVL